jgi:Putative adhesin
MKSCALVLVSITLAGGIACAAQADGSFDRSLTVSGPVDLDIKTDSGGIAVSPGPSGYVRVHAILKSQHGWLHSSDVESRIRQLERNPPVKQTGNRIQIGYVRDRDLLKGISMRLEIQAPPDTQIRARADSGGVRVEGIRGPADCHTDSGGIEIYDIGSDVRANADSGGIHLKNINGSAFAHVDSGGIEASQVAGTIDAQADSGGIRLAQTRPAPIRARADSGGVTVKLASSGGYDISAESESGHISVPEMTVVRGAFSPHHVEGKVRSGGPLVSIHVDSGNVTVE